MINLYGPVDLVRLRVDDSGEPHAGRPTNEDMYIGGPPSYPDRYRLVSSLSHIKHSAPPAISFVGLSVRFRQVPALVEILVEFYPEAQWQRCVVHFYRNVWTAKR